MVRAAAKNHANVAIVTVARRATRRVLAALDGGRASVAAAPAARAGRRGVPPHRRLRRPDRGRAAGPHGRRRRRAAGRARAARLGGSVSADADDRAREGRVAALRREPAPAGGALPAPGPAARRRPVRDRASRRCRARRSRTTTSSTRRPRRRSRGRCAGPACVIVKHTNPCGAAERATLARGVGGRARRRSRVARSAGVVALTRAVDAAMAEALTSIFLEVVVAPGLRRRRAGDPRREAEPARSSSTRAGVGRRRRPRPLAPTGSIRTAGGAVLVTAPDTRPTTRPTWTVVTRRAPTDAERRDLDLAWRLVRGVTSNAIVLVRDGRLIGLGSGQTSAASTPPGRPSRRPTRCSATTSTAGAACASDAFFPFPDARRGLPGGRRHRLRPARRLDARRGGVAAVDAAGATMLVTGRRHFRH